MADDMDLDPSGFVQRIRQLGEQHDQHDQHEAERVKKLEEELIQGRSERLARRAGGFSCSAPSLPIPFYSCSCRYYHSVSCPHPVFSSATTTLPPSPLCAAPPPARSGLTDRRPQQSAPAPSRPTSP
jgi:hypothetical protein